MHDRCCPVDNLPGDDCLICEAIVAARQEEITARNEIWRVNLPLVVKRNYERGYRDGRTAR